MVLVRVGKGGEGKDLFVVYSHGLSGFGVAGREEGQLMHLLCIKCQV